jgi:predicted RNA methylase
MKLRELVAELENVKTWEKPRVELEQYPTPPDIAAQMLMTADAEGDVEDALVVDLGCGGCILGIAAALLGAGHVTGIDIDPAAITIAAQNVEEAEVIADLAVCDVLELAMRSSATSSCSRSGLAQSSAADDHTNDVAAAKAAAAAAALGAFPSFIASTYTTKVEYEVARAAAAEAAAAAVPNEGSSLEEEGTDGGCLPPIGGGAYDLVLMNPPFGTQQASTGIDMRFLRAGLALCAPDGAVYSLNKTSTRRFIAKTAARWGASARVVAELKFEIPKMYKHHKHASLDVEVDFWRFTPQANGEGASEGGVAAAQAPFSASQAGGKGGDKGAGKEAGGRGRGGGKGGGKDDGRDCRRVESQQAVAGSRQTARAKAKARLDFYGGGSGKGKKTESTKRGDGVRFTKLG